MYESFLKCGFTGRQPHEVLEQLLFESIPRANTNEIGHRLIQKFGSVMDVLFASKEELCQVEGVGERTAEWIMEVRFRIGDMILAQFAEGDRLTEADLTVISSWHMVGLPDEWIGVVLCDVLGNFQSFGYLIPEEGETETPWDAAAIAEKLCESEEVSFSLLLPEESPLCRDDAEGIRTATEKNGVFLRGVYRVKRFMLEPILVVEAEEGILWRMPNPPRR